MRWTPYRRAHEGERLLREACRNGWEGLIAKRADSPYAGKRTRDWLKWKCSAEQELVIGGYTAPRGSREDFGALLVGFYDGDVLRYAGKVGTGFDARELRTLGAAHGRARAARLPLRRRRPARAATRRGSSPSSWPRSPSPSGRATGACATRATWACATTSPRARWCASALRESRRPRRTTYDDAVTKLILPFVSSTA